MNAPARLEGQYETLAFQIRLAELNKWRLTPRTGAQDYASELSEKLPLLLAENAFLEEQRRAVAPLICDMPHDAARFVEWFETLQQWGPGQTDPLFAWLAETATLDEMRWFLAQEVAGEAGFEDLTAITQVRFEARPKLEMARNYWDEMGRGAAKGMHGPMLQHLSEALGLRPRPEDTVWEALALANTMSGMAANRHFAYHAVGALGVIEMTAPGRAALVDKGLKRLGVKAGDRHYFTLHAVLDVKHSQAWNEEVIRPLAAQEEVRIALAQGALMRLACGKRCFETYRATLWGRDERGVTRRRGT